MSTQRVEKQWIAAAEGQCPDMPDELLESLYPGIWNYGPYGDQLLETAARITKALENGYPVTMTMHLEDMAMLGLFRVTDSIPFLQAGTETFGKGKDFERAMKNVDWLVHQATKSGRESDDTQLNKAILMCMRLLSVDILAKDAAGKTLTSKSKRSLRNLWASDVETFLETL